MITLKEVVKISLEGKAVYSHRQHMGEPKGEVFTSLSSGSGASFSPSHCHHYTPAICAFTCLCLQTAVLHADSHGSVYDGFPLSQEYNVTLISEVHTAEVPQYSKG